MFSEQDTQSAPAHVSNDTAPLPGDDTAKRIVQSDELISRSRRLLAETDQLLIFRSLPNI
jgi:hypothetical protein